MINDEVEIKVTNGLLKHYLRNVPQCECCNVYGEVSDFTDTFYGKVCCPECLEALKDNRKRCNEKLALIDGHIFKCWSCAYTVQMTEAPVRQPLCPTCSHHPRMYSEFTPEGV